MNSPSAHQRPSPTHATTNDDPSLPTPSPQRLADGHTLGVILETAEHISDRTARLSTSATESIRASETLNAVARQIRTLSSNTSLEASRLGGSATVAEIARQMRLLSQQVSALSEQISTSLRLQNVALGELSNAMDGLLADASTARASLASPPPGLEPGPRGAGARMELSKDG